MHTTHPPTLPPPPAEGSAPSVADATVTLSPLFPDAWLVAGSTPLALHTCVAVGQPLEVAWSGVGAPAARSTPLTYSVSLHAVSEAGDAVGVVGPVGVAPEALPEAVYGAGSGAVVLEQGVLGDGSPTWVKACVVASGPSGLAR